MKNEDYILGGLQSRGHTIEILGAHTGHSVAPAAFCSTEEIAKEIVQRLRQRDELIEALSFYVSICGNTAYSVTRESAQEAYAMACKALGKKPVT